MSDNRLSDGVSDDAFIGRGWSYPIGPSIDGTISMVEGIDEIEQAVYLILATYPGERPMRPEFGTPLADFVFDPADGRTFGRIAYVVDEALRRWEPRIVVDDVIVGSSPESQEKILIEIQYHVRGEYNRRNLLVPFYRIPAGGDV